MQQDEAGHALKTWSKKLPESVRTLLQVILLSVGYYNVASPAAQMEDFTTLAAICWPAPAFMIVFLWRLPYRQWWIYLLGVFVAMMFVGDLDWLSPQSDAGFSLLNVIEIALCAWLGKKYVVASGSIESMQQLVRFLLLLPLAAVALIAMLGATIAANEMHTNWWHEWQVLMVGNGLSILVLVPALLSLSAVRKSADSLFSPSVLTTILGIVATVVAVLAAVFFDISEELLRAMLSLLLVAIAIYGGIKSASVTMAVEAALSIGLTLYGLGPYREEGINSVWRLQVDLIGLAVLTFFVGIAVLERQRLTLRLEQARRFESLGFLAGGIAHDFNNILGAVGGYAEMASEHVNAATPARKALNEVISAVARGKDLTQQILLATRRGDRRRIVMDLREAAYEVLSLATPLCRQGVQIKLQTTQEILPVLAHPDQMTRVLLNLVRNASQAARSEVVVTLGSGEITQQASVHIGDIPSPAVWVEISDDGMGIAEEHLRQLFDPFFSTRNSAEGKGTGLGLAIVAGIATEHNGGVSVVTTLGRGSVFRFYLPLVLTEQVQTLSVKQEDCTPIGTGQTVLLLEDDPQLLECYEEWLAQLGFEPLGYSDPALALADVERQDCQLFMLLSDLDMPQLRGNEVVTELRHTHPQLPVLLCSGSNELEAIATSIDVMALRKPFSQAQLRQAIITVTHLNNKKGE